MGSGGEDLAIVGRHWVVVEDKDQVLGLVGVTVHGVCGSDLEPRVIGSNPPVLD